jgi:predicted dehydrogenase
LSPRGIAIVGCGEIARKQHARFLCSDANDTGFRLVATADPHASMDVEDVRHYPDHRTMLAAEPELAAVAVCTPTFTHFEIARDALLAGKHTLLEKPPASTVAELVELQRIAAERGVVLCTSFHSQHNEAVRQAADLLARIGPGRNLPEKNLPGRNLKVLITWRENYDRWHPGQRWPWQRGGCGVFDSGINALSMLSHILPNVEFRVLTAKFLLPANAETPSTATLQLSADETGRGDFLFEWTKGGEDLWEIEVSLEHAGAARETITIKNFNTLSRNGKMILEATTGGDEYAGVYRKFADTVKRGVTVVSYKEMRIIEEAFALAETQTLRTSY